MTSSAPSDEATSAKLLRSKVLQRQDALDTGFENTKLWGSKRLLVAILMFFSYIYIFMLRGNLSIAIVEMTSEKNITIGDKIVTQKPEFSWDMKTKGWILSVFSYGFLFSAVGGYLSTKYGGVRVVGLGVMCTAIITILSPVTLRTSVYLFAIGRVAEGLFDSFAFAGTSDVWSKWIPTNELPQIVIISHVGHNVAASTTFPLCGLIAEYFGWPMIFYFSGTFAMIWCIIFLTFVRNDPSQDTKISPEELRYLKRSIEIKDRQTIKYPWKKILTSKPLWCLCLNKMAYSWSQATVIHCFPLYIKDMTKRNTAHVGLLSGIPNVINIFLIPIIGLLIGYLQNSRGFNPSQLHKWILTIGFSSAGALFIAVGFTNFTISLICFVLTVIFLSACSSIHHVMTVSISRDHAGLVAGIASFWYSVSAIVAPLSLGFIVVDHTYQEWGIFFALSGCIAILAAIITVLFGSSGDQNWSSTSTNQDEDFNTIEQRQ
ncbi:sialin-like [Planococcus citri]|uniref:sialin-like n=1 Tax=Planococcus citri TaxID=170843 RepID=UPI0031F8DE95